MQYIPVNLSKPQSTAVLTSYEVMHKVLFSVSHHIAAELITVALGNKNSSHLGTIVSAIIYNCSVPPVHAFGIVLQRPSPPVSFRSQEGQKPAHSMEDDWLWEERSRLIPASLVTHSLPNVPVVGVWERGYIPGLLLTAVLQEEE